MLNGPSIAFLVVHLEYALSPTVREFTRRDYNPQWVLPSRFHSQLVVGGESSLRYSGTRTEVGQTQRATSAGKRDGKISVQAKSGMHETWMNARSWPQSVRCHWW